MTTERDDSRHPDFPELTRRAELARPQSAETIPAVLSTSAPVRHAIGPVILRHDADAVDLSRAERGLILLDGHWSDTSGAIGRVDNVRLDGEVSRGDIHINGTNEAAKRIRADIEAGVPYGVSIRFGVGEWTEPDKRGEPFEVTKWEMLEASIVAIPRDSGAGLFRAYGDNERGEPMPKDDTGGNNQAAQNMRPFPAEVVHGAAGGDFQAGRQAEAERLRGLRDLFGLPGFKGDAYKRLQRHCEDEGVTLEQARAWVAELAGQAGEQEAISSQLPPGFGQGQRDAGTAPIQMGQTGGEKFLEHMQWALEFRAGFADGERAEQERKAAENPFAGLRLDEMARQYARRAGLPGADTARAYDIVSALMDRNRPVSMGDMQRNVLGATSSDFPALLANTVNKVVRLRYSQAEEVWRQLAFITPGGIPNFKQGSRPAPSAFSNLDTIPEGGEYKHGDLGEVVEYIKAKKIGKKFSITREAILDDDLGELMRSPMHMADAASRSLADEFWLFYTNPPTLNQDNKAVFHADHKNTGTAGAPSVTTLSEHRRLHRTMKDPSGKKTVGIAPRFLLLPPSYETEGLVLLQSQEIDIDVGGSAKETVTKRAPNQFGRMVPVVEHRLGGTAGTDTLWFTQAAPNSMPYLEVGFVNDNQTPFVGQREGWEIDGVEYKIRLEFAIAALDFRGICKNAG